MKNKSKYIDVCDLKDGDIFYPSRNYGWCKLLHTTGFDFYTSNQNMWIESTGKKFAVSMPLNKKVRIKQNPFGG